MEEHRLTKEEKEQAAAYIAVLGRLDQRLTQEIMTFLDMVPPKEMLQETHTAWVQYIDAVKADDRAPEVEKAYAVAAAKSAMHTIEIILDFLRAVDRNIELTQEAVALQPAVHAYREQHL